MVITLKDGSIATLFESKEAIDIIGQELYDFILQNQVDKNILEEEIYEKECEIRDLEDEISSYEETISKLNSVLDDTVEKLKEYNDNLDEFDNELYLILNMLQDAYDIIN